MWETFCDVYYMKTWKYESFVINQTVSDEFHE